MPNSKIPHAASTIDPRHPSGLLIGQAEICAYLRISATTLKRWRSHHGLPIAYLPQGHVAITTSMIDAWLLDRVPSVPVNGRWERTRAIRREQAERAEQAQGA